MILFGGDSFSAYDDENCWPNIFAKEIGLDFKNYSIEGSSLWTAFDRIDVEDYRLLQGYYNYLIVTCTNYRRIPFCQNPHDSAFLGKVEKEPIDNEEKKKNSAHVNYYDKFYSEKMHKFLYNRILEFIITKFCNHTKIIFLPVIDDSLISIKDANKSYENSFSFLNFSLDKISHIAKDKKNHMTIETNKIFGKLLADNVKQNEYGPINLTIEDIKKVIK